MKTSWLPRLLTLACALVAISSILAVDQPAVPATADTEQKLESELLKLHDRRVGMKLVAGSSEANQLIAALKALHERAKSIDHGYTYVLLNINTELEILGVAPPLGEHRFGVINQMQTIKPLIFVDPKTRIIYYVESDGRHVTAIAPEGKILWHRDPFFDAKLTAVQL